MVSSESGEKYAQIKHCLQVLFTYSKQMWMDFDVRGQQGINIFTGGNIMGSYCGQKQRF